jgi:Concanavalin A-like lectin/glucanases superfamily
MIRKLVIIVMSLIVILNAKAQNIPVYLPKDSLVGWYPFNGNSNDESGKGHHLNNTTAVLETDRHGNKNNGYSLSNGGRLSYFGKSITGGEAFTYSFWMKTNKNLNDYPDGIFSESGVNESGHETGIWFFFEPNTKDFGIVNPGISYAGILRKNFPYIDEWHHVVVQGPVDYKIFVDGKLFTTGSSNYKKFADSCLFHIGGFQGSVDDFSIHNRILTSDEIQALYKNSAPIIELPSNLPKDGLVGWWPFNGNANDESGNENHGTVNGAKLTLDRNGKENSAYSFNGSSSFIEGGFK